MRILIIQDRLRIGGTERQSLILAEMFDCKGHETTILTFRPGGHLYHDAHKSALSIQTLQKFDSGLSFWAPGLKRKIRELNAEIILCMGRTANCYAGFLQGSFPDTPVVGTVRTGKRIFPLHKWSLSRVRAVLVNSNWGRDKLIKSDCPGASGLN